MVIENGEVRKPPAENKLLPGMAVIAIWMLIEAAVGALGAFQGAFPGPARNGVLGIATILLGCGLGLIQRRRWGWALSLAAAFFSFGFGVYAVTRLHEVRYSLMAFLNAVFFLYLVRPEVRARLRN